jgi:hypothetical protein
MAEVQHYYASCKLINKSINLALRLSEQICQRNLKVKQAFIYLYLEEWLFTLYYFSLRVYHHQGECTTLHMREGGDRDELMEIVVRLRAVTGGCVAQELSLRRNPMGQLGFHVQPDGVVTQVESLGLAWQAGLRHGARLVEVSSPLKLLLLYHDVYLLYCQDRACK